MGKAKLDMKVDHKISELFDYPPSPPKISLPGSYDLSDQFPPPGDQKTPNPGVTGCVNQVASGDNGEIPNLKDGLNSCVGFALGYGIKTFHEKIENDWELKNKDNSLNYDHVFSPSFLYNICYNKKKDRPEIQKAIDKFGSPTMSITEGLDILKEHGICSLKDFPYIKDYNIIPDKNLMKKAEKYKIDKKTYRVEEDIENIKRFLIFQKPILIITTIPKNLFERGYVTVDKNFSRRNGELIYDRKLIYGKIAKDYLHAMVIVGYNDKLKGLENENQEVPSSQGALKIINSWGPNWGNNGYFWMTYDKFNYIKRKRSKYKLQLFLVLDEGDSLNYSV
ncbi:MAG: C1 family peptidase [Spirochaetota bacterium]|nr:C1 family peptidase [Spirochaetota bacterium]